MSATPYEQEEVATGSHKDEKSEPEWRRAAMPQSQRFATSVDLAFEHNIVVHATQNIDTGSCIWDAALVLGSYFCNERIFPPHFWPMKRVCEIGAGCGVTGIVVAQLGADVVLTELEEELKLLENNVRQNPIFPSPYSSLLHSTHVGSTQTKKYYWGTDPSHLNAPFDIVIAADCVYELQLFDELAKALVDISSDNTIAYFCIEHRWSDIEEWWWKAIKQHFTIRLVPHSDHGPYSHPTIDIYELRKKKLWKPVNQ